MTTQSVAKTDGAVVELVSFTPAELDIITDALRVASAHYQFLAETVNVPDTSFAPRQEFRERYWEQSHEAGALQLKIEAAR